MKAIGAALLIAGLLLFASPISASPHEGSSTPSGRLDARALEPHPPIVVVGDTGPTGLVLATHPLTGEPIYRPGSGVVGGRGTAEDPYLIEGWEVPAIRIQGTTAHVEIRGNSIGVAAAPGGVASLHVEDAGDVRVADNEVLSTTSGILVTGSDDITVEDNVVQGGQAGIDGDATEGLLVRGNTVTDANYAVRMNNVGDLLVEGNELIDTAATMGTGVLLQACREVVVEANRIVRHHTGVYAVDTDGARVRDNDISSFSRGINFWFSDDEVIERNTIAGHATGAIILIESNDGVVRDNDLTGGLTGVDLRGPGSGILVEANEARGVGIGILLAQLTGPHEIRGNLLIGNETAITLSQTSGSTFLGNLILENETGVSAISGVDAITLGGNQIVGNDEGVANDTEASIDARENWWGCAEGPGAAGCDTTRGSVQWDPWLIEEPEA